MMIGGSGDLTVVHLDHLPGTFFGPSNLVELLLHRARCQPEDTAFTYLVDGENEQVHLTYRELDRHARAIGAWLEAHDLVGERALLLYPAGLEFIVAFFGCLYAGVVAVPVYPPRRNRSLNRIQAIADDADARVALTTELVLNRVMPLIDETPHLKQLAWLATCKVPVEMERDWSMPDVHGDTLAFLQYTSGSTGTPKGVVLNHANLVHNSALISHAFEHGRSGKGVFWLPSYHDMGLIGGILQPLYIGRPNVLISPMSFLQKPYRWLSAISRFRGTTSGGPNFAYDLCVRKITPEQRKTLDLSTWRVAFNGAEPVRAETLDAFSEAFAPCGFRREAFYPCFGLAEATLIVSGGYAAAPPVIRAFDAAGLARREVIDADPDDEGVRALVGCGQNLPDQKIVIADPESRTACPAGRVGEIWVHGPSVAQGYWQQPEITERMFRARLKDTGEGPFLRTGDLGFLQDGELFVTGRLKDLIIVRGVNFYPQDIERTVQQSHPRLRPDCGAAFTVEAGRREQLIIVQEVERHKQSDFSGIFTAIRQAVAGEHELAPDAIVLIRAGSVPKTSSGKIQRHACRDSYRAGTLDAVGQWSAADTPAEAPLAAGGQIPAVEPAEVIARPRRSAILGSSGNGRHDAAGDRLTQLVVEEIRRVAKERADGMTLDSPIVETGMDSLERMEIVASLEEKFAGRFPEEILPELETTRQLVAAVEKYLGREPRPLRARDAGAEIPPAAYRFDQFPEYVRLRENLDMLESSGLGNPFFAVHDGPTMDRTIVDGRELINFSSYNYLGMSGDVRVSAAAKAAIDRYGTSASASRLVSGQKGIHVELEAAITRFLGAEDTIAMVGGHATNETVIGHLVGPGDLILHDGLAHNSIVQGCLLSGARRRPFPHNDWQAADRLLEQFRHEYRRVLVAIEGVYSMDGDVPDLPRFVEVKKRHHALLMIDEAHSLGVLGPTGRGIGEHYGVDRGDVDVWMGTLSKTLGSCGGYISGCKALVEYLRYTAPGFVYAAAMAPPAAAAALAALRLLEAEPQRVARLRENSRLFLRLARQHGLNTGMSANSAVVPVILGNSIQCLALAKAMSARGVNVNTIVHPAVEENAARLRYFITALHTEQQLRYTVEAMVEELENLRDVENHPSPSLQD
jgi:8-amino-7-oxononanoate synthase